MALVQLNAGNIDTALEYLEEVLSIPSTFSTAWVEMDPRWEPVRDHPRYKEIIAKYEGIKF
ncbi:MAG: hypothetical protein OEV49_06030 [candidate division Zixibacteria bacterium]|nr:hypothetical protein [candidate division Zixibacteria bacterium]MDH4034974.1 hypothetical protein [candidate division Zixibacteria bacterium]